MRGKSPIRLAAALIALSLLLVLVTCGQRRGGVVRLDLAGSGTPPAEQQAGQDDGGGVLPPVMALDELMDSAPKGVRAGSQVISLGSDYSPEGSGTTSDSEYSIEVDGSDLHLRAYEPGEYTYALFAQQVGDGEWGGGRDDEIPLQSLIDSEVCDSGGGRDDEIPLSYYVGVADYSVGCWRWFGPFGRNDETAYLSTDTLKSRFKSPNDNLYLAVLTASGDKTASRLPEDGLVGELPFAAGLRNTSQAGEDPCGVTIVRVVTDADSGIGTEPEVVTGLAASIEADRISLSWNPNPDPDVTSYEIYRKEAGIEGPPVWLDSVAAPVTGYDDMSAEAGVTYVYGVQAVNDVGPGGMGYVSVGPPVIRGVSPTSGSEGALVKFVAIVSGSQPFTYAWDFGGGATPNTSTEARPAVTLGTPNTYSAALTATNAFGEDTYDFTLIVQESGGWHIVTLDIAIGWGAPGSFAIVNGNPAGSYCDSDDGYLKYVRASDASGSSWGIPVIVDTQGRESEYVSLAVVNGNPAISYYDSTNEELKYVRASDAQGSSWGSPVAFPSDRGTVEDTCLVVVNGQPAISYWDETNEDLKYLRSTDANGSSFGATVTVDSAGSYGGHPTSSLCVVNGNPAIITLYYNGTDYECDIIYVRAIDANGDTWGTPVTVDITGDNVGEPSIAVVNGNPAISYYDYTNHDLMYVRATDANGASWGTPVTVDSEGDTHYFPSLATVNGNPAISYCVCDMDWTNADLKYVRASDAGGTTWGTPVTVDSTGDVGFGASLAVVNGNPAISYYDSTNGDMKFAIYY